MTDNPEFTKKQRKLMWFTGITALLILIFLVTISVSQYVHAQIDRSFYENIDDPELCEKIRIFGEKAWVPFRLVITHPPTDQITTSISTNDKTKESRDVISTEGRFDFLTNETNTWTIGYTITYPIDPVDPSLKKDRAFVVEYASEGKTTQIETRRINGNQFCQLFEITTDVAPEFPVIEDFLTDLGIQSVREMQFVVPTIETLDSTIGRGTFVNAIQIIAVFGLIIYMFFKAKEFGETKISTQRQILQATKNSNKQTEEAKKGCRLYL